jgi:hypothetical protein
MTIQVAVMNGYGVALASDRHVFRGGEARSTGQDVKLLRLRGAIPAAMMASGPFAVFGLPVARLAMRLERALAAAPPGPDALACAILAALDVPVEGPVAEPQMAGATARAPAGDLYLTVGLVCPQTGVPALVSLRLSQGADNRLHATSRLDSDYEVSWRAGRTVVVAQGSGRALVEAMVDGLGDEHWTALDLAARERLRPGMEGRWDRAHGRLGVASPRELAAIATGLVRGAEVIGFMTREAEGTVAEVDCLCLTPREVLLAGLDAGPALNVAA